MSGFRARFAAAALASLTVSVALAACGGDDETTTTTATETATSAENVRLEPAAWEEYVQERDEARAVNNEAIETFNKCRNLFETSPPEEAYECMGDSAADVVDEGEDVLSFLDGLAADVSGECATATTNLSGNVKIYTATVNQIALALDRPALPTIQSIESSLAQLTRTRAASANFETACKPA